MGRPPKEPLREVTAEERSALEQIGRASSERADRVARAKMLLAVAEGDTFTGAARSRSEPLGAARSVGRRFNDAVAELVKRFNAEGLLALDPRHGGGPKVEYGPLEKVEYGPLEKVEYGPLEMERILREFRRKPDPEQDGTATWSLTTLQRALRKAEGGLPKVSTWTILR